MRRVIFCSVLFAIILSSAAFSADEPTQKFSAIQISKFDVKPGVQKFTPEYGVTLTEDIIKELQQTGKFKQVLREGEKADGEGTSKLLVSGTITEFDPGSRAARYLVGFGAGKTKIVAQVRFIDAETQKVVWEDKMDGRVWIGMFGGESIGATKGLAKELAKKTKQHFFGESTPSPKK